MREAHGALAGEAVERGRRVALVAVAPEPIGAQRVDRDDEDVRRARGARRRLRARAERDDEAD
jgi:hypothetical protein